MPENEKVSITLTLSEETWGMIAGHMGGAYMGGMLTGEPDEFVREYVDAHNTICDRFGQGQYAQ